MTKRRKGLTNAEFAEMKRWFNGDLTRAAKLLIDMIEFVVTGQKKTKTVFIKVDKQGRSIYVNEKAARDALKYLRTDFTKREINLVIRYYRSLGWIKKEISSKKGFGKVEINGEYVKALSLNYIAVNALKVFTKEDENEH